MHRKKTIGLWCGRLAECAECSFTSEEYCQASDLDRSLSAAVAEAPPRPLRVGTDGVSHAGAGPRVERGHAERWCLLQEQGLEGLAIVEGGAGGIERVAPAGWLVGEADDCPTGAWSSRRA